MSVFALVALNGHEKILSFVELVNLHRILRHLCLNDFWVENETTWLSLVIKVLRTPPLFSLCR